MPLILYKSGVRLFIYRRLNILIRNYGLVFDGVYTTSSDIFFFFPPLISILIFFFFGHRMATDHIHYYDDNKIQPPV